MQEREGRQAGRRADGGADRRIMNLLFCLNTASSPLTTERIVSDSDMGYGSGNVASDKKKFARDRERLRELGVVVREVRTAGAAVDEQSAWTIDRELTHVTSGIITTDDAHVLASAIDEYLTRDDIPYRAELESARVKLAGNVQRSETVGSPANKIHAALWSAFTQRLKLPFTYRDAAGNTGDKLVAIWGIFTHKGRCYFTGADQSGHIKTFRADRVKRTKKPKGTYTIPADFSVRSYVFLPFDFGEDEAVRVRFSFAAEIGAAELLTITQGRGTLERRLDGSHIWDVEVRDIKAAAAFALAHTAQGMRPVSPAPLISSYKALVAKAVENHG